MKKLSDLSPTQWLTVLGAISALLQIAQELGFYPGLMVVLVAIITAWMGYLQKGVDDA
jgi:hypothetical protein